jgi:hypothetical protein
MAEINRHFGRFRGRVIQPATADRPGLIYRKGGENMKKVVILSSLFIGIFGLTLGFAISTFDTALAAPECPEECHYDLYCSYDTGPNCTNPYRPYYMYTVDGCQNYPGYWCPLNGAFYGCCNMPGRTIYYVEPEPL